MHQDKIHLTLGAILAVTLLPAEANAQDLMTLDKSTLRTEIDRRYSAALAATTDQQVVAVDDNRFMWASQAKAQCGIAIGFLKSGTKDAVSIAKCDDAFNRMQVKAPPVEAVYTPPPPVVCNRGPLIVFFDWDKSEIINDQASSLDSIAATYPGCGGAPVSIVGYADRSGSDRYNIGLSERRAQAVKDYLASQGMPVGAMATEAKGEANPRVPTVDGVRELQNRRVEIIVN